MTVLIETNTGGASTGTVTIGSGGLGGGTGINDVTLTGKTVKLQGDITAAGTGATGAATEDGDVDINGAFVVDGDVTITTDVTGTVNDGKIDFATNTINAEGNNTDSLTLTSGAGQLPGNHWCDNTFNRLKY